MTLTELLAKISLLNRDNGRSFTDTSRLDAISQLLAGSNYSKINSDGLFHLYSQQKIPSKPAVIISSHVDCERHITKCFSEILPDGILRGTFDNAITNAAILHLMLTENLADNVLAAFTGDEEESSQGAAQLIEFARRAGIKIQNVIVLDVTDMGWAENSDFTIENNFWSETLGQKIIASAESSGFNWRFVPSDPDDNSL